MYISICIIDIYYFIRVNLKIVFMRKLIGSGVVLKKQTVRLCVEAIKSINSIYYYKQWTY